MRTTGGQATADLTDLNMSERGDIAEEHAGPTLLEERGLVLNETFHGAEDSGTLDTGFDIVAKDPESEDWYVVEAKFRSTKASVSDTDYWFNTTKNDGQQMSEEWIDAKIDELRRSEDEEMARLGRELRLASDRGDLHGEVIVVQNADQNHLTITQNTTNLDVERVHLVKLDRVIS